MRHNDFQIAELSQGPVCEDFNEVGIGARTSKMILFFS
jgi:hypothetical protein